MWFWIFIVFIILDVVYYIFVWVVGIIYGIVWFMVFFGVKELGC